MLLLVDSRLYSSNLSDVERWFLGTQFMTRSFVPVSDTPEVSRPVQVKIVYVNFSKMVTSVTKFYSRDHSPSLRTQTWDHGGEVPGTGILSG